MTYSTPPSDQRKSAGSRIDPATAEVWFEYGPVTDPYGELPPAVEENYGRMWYAADPKERLVVSFYDLPNDIREGLEEKRRAADREGWADLLGQSTDPWSIYEQAEQATLMLRAVFEALKSLPVARVNEIDDVLNAVGCDLDESSHQLLQTFEWLSELKNSVA